jgi:hypothetical protein
VPRSSGDLEESLKWVADEAAQPMTGFVRRARASTVSLWLDLAAALGGLVAALWLGLYSVAVPWGLAVVVAGLRAAEGGRDSGWPGMSRIRSCIR